MAKYDLTDDEATTYITQGVDFGMTQLVDGNWGMHAVVPKAIFEGRWGTTRRPAPPRTSDRRTSRWSIARKHWRSAAACRATRPWFSAVADGAGARRRMATHHAAMTGTR